MQLIVLSLNQYICADLNIHCRPIALIPLVAANNQLCLSENEGVESKDRGEVGGKHGLGCSVD